MKEDKNFRSLHLPKEVYERFEKAIEKYKKEHRVTIVYPWQVLEFLVIGYIEEPKKGNENENPQDS
jgi:hypothetical protein